MRLTPQHTRVLINGAGPSGLMMAAQLLRNGIQPIIIDQKQGPTNNSNALVVQARSLEIYRQLGIIDQVIKNGNPVKGASFYIEGQQKATFALTDIGTGQTAYPYLLLYQQSKNERALLDYLTLACCPVYWDTSLVSVTLADNRVETIIQNGEETVNITCDWLIGADGAHSTVRKQLQIPFNGDTYAHEFYLADVKLDNDTLSADEVQLYLSKQGFAGFFPMPEAKRFRIVGNLPAGTSSAKELKMDDVLPVLNQVTQQQINVTETDWFTVYRLHHRMADAFRKQRCFLIGDAAHIHSPVGGQGMNTGLQDAYNLGWKLAGVVNGQLREAVLDSYAAERMPVAKTLLGTTDRLFTLIMSQSWLMTLFKKWVLPRVLNFVWTKETTRSGFFKRISQTGIGYRHSSINLHLSTATSVKAGDRLPYLKIFDEKKQQETDLHNWCSKPGFTLIVLGNLSDLDLFTLAKWLTQNHPATVNFFYLPPSKKNRAVFDRFEINEGRKKALIVRPDMHICFINDVVDIEMMDNYLYNVMGIIKTAV